MCDHDNRQALFTIQFSEQLQDVPTGFVIELPVGSSASNSSGEPINARR
ncbi:MAG: hypothetical protein U0892_22990 [Pirellulales bacterium]